MRTAIVTVALCLMLAACDQSPPTYQPGNELVIVDEDAPPCRPVDQPCPPRR